MKPNSPMLVPLREMPLERSFALEAEFVREALAGAPGQDALEGEALAKPGEIQVAVHLMVEGTSVFARGEIKGWVFVACSRCAEAMRLTVREAVQTTFLPHTSELEQQLDSEAEVELNEADLDVSTYKGEQVDLSEIVRDQLVLAVPFAPLCREDCGGIAGHDRAGWSFQTEAEAQADAPKEDPRFAVLKKLKLD